jgi:hypothetical protein
VSRLTLLSLSVIALTHVGASADTVTYYSGGPYNTGPALGYGPTVLNWPAGAQLPFQQWDPNMFPAGAALVSAEITLYAKLSGEQGWFLEEGPVPGQPTMSSIQLTDTMTATLTGPSSTFLISVTPSQTDSWNAGYSAPASGSATLNQLAFNSVPVAVPFSYLATYYTGSGMFHASLTGQQNLSVQGGGAAVVWAEAYGAAAGKIVYTYSSNVPEPGTLALVGFGLIGLVGFARTRRSAAHPA